MEDITQERAEEYIAVKKRLRDKNHIDLTTFDTITETVISDTHRDIFKLDLRKNRIEFKAVNCNCRVHDCYCLVRLDVKDREHKNPDDKITSHYSRIMVRERTSYHI